MREWIQGQRGSDGHRGWIQGQSGWIQGQRGSYGHRGWIQCVMVWGTGLI
jgi:hypothetical protein